MNPANRYDASINMTGQAPMRSILFFLIVAALAGCSSQSSHTLKVAGSSDEVSKFVAAEKGLDGNADVDYRPGQTEAMFSLQSENDLNEAVERATKARLRIASRSSSYEFGTSYKAVPIPAD